MELNKNAFKLMVNSGSLLIKFLLFSITFILFLTACGSAPSEDAVTAMVVLAGDPVSSVPEDVVVDNSGQEAAQIAALDDQIEDSGDLGSAFDAYSEKQQAGVGGGGGQPSENEAALAMPVAGDTTLSQSGESAQLLEAPVEMQSPADQPPSKPETGFTAPDFDLVTVDGSKIDISSLRGKPTLINYWTSWCIPCLEELPVLEELSRDFPEVNFISINGVEQDDLSAVKQTIANLSITHLILLDVGEQFWKNYGVMFLPTSFFIDRHGIIQHVQFGSLTEGQLRKKLEQLRSGS